MSVIFSSVTNIMLKSARQSSRALIRDFSEIRYMQSSYTTASNFTRSAYLRSKKIITDGLYNYRQDYGIIFDDTRDASDVGENFWFVNPIDSRTNFINYLPYFATLIAFFRQGEPVAAVIDAPILKETFYVEKGVGAFSENVQSRYIKMHVGNKQSISRAVIDFVITHLNVGMIDKQLNSQAVIIRAMGSMTLGFSYLCSASYDALIYSNLNKYQAAVGKLFIEESKGKVVCDNDLFIASNFTLCDYLRTKFNNDK
ncbi:inositol monophosphatase family protein [Ehrlichia chaffeensis str. Heartland]|nr:inositol monophosphatase family protein [Ehrlichia chaffeensis]AHX03833.1 inositol monophosphatase family protein [Ehrlichia chaffeensis str. Heartland]AHX05442.1 inositol monophosphatase family protein [Ehrlichia chaffeensis str. Jax]AHX06430.1 inositol monophosphatase family protein [Ehrlichia chaffeensis str. Liberty]AHX07243.1 inositol monophosphatase family protein [Ehrlichia chaffeensis str. Osceola]AHX08714.1 inositol monophosphatase family protein [Ehrlichia chaffeensis str. Saint V